MHVYVHWQTKCILLGSIVFDVVFSNEYRSADINEVQMQDVRRPQGDTIDLDLIDAQDDEDMTVATDKLDETSGGGERRRASNK